jgi:hypothetical protein
MKIPSAASNQTSGDMPSRKARGRRLQILGVSLLVGGYLCFKGERSETSEPTVSWFEFLVFVMACAAMPSGGVIAYYGRQLAARTARDAIAEDARPPIVYLRSFKDDNNRTFFLGLIWTLSVVAESSDLFETHEEILAKVFSKYGPLVAIGRPGESLPTLGAARMYVSHEEWHGIALNLIRSAVMVIVRLGRTEGVWWEVTTALSFVRKKRLLFELSSGWLSRKSIYLRFRNAVAEACDVSLPEYKRKYRFVYFDAEGTPHLLVRKIDAPRAKAFRKTLATVLDELSRTQLPSPTNPATKPFATRGRAKQILAVAGVLGGLVVLQVAVDAVFRALRGRPAPAPSAPSPVLGEVRDVDGHPARGRVVACEGSPAEVERQSAADGSFQLPSSAIGCEAVAEHSEFASSDPVRVAKGGHIVLRLKSGGEVAGVVVDERGVAVFPFQVGIESFSPSRGKAFDLPPAQTFGDPAGAFRWSKLAPGRYVLVGLATGRSWARSGSIEVRGGSVTSGVRIAIAQGGRLEGTVTDEAHAPLAGVDICFDEVCRVFRGEGISQTDGAGHYHVDGAPASRFTLRARKDGFRTKLVSGLQVDAGAKRSQDITLAADDGGATLELGGTGTLLTLAPEGLTLERAYPDEPAARAGLRAGDRIIRIDGAPTDGMSLAEAMEQLRGEPGTGVGLSVLRPETGRVIEATIVRVKIVN